MSKQERNGWFVCIASLVLQAVVMYKSGYVPGVTPSAHTLDIVIAQEGTEQNSKFGILWGNLRNGTFEAYRKQKGHTLEIIDKDVTDENGVKIVPDSDIAGKKLPLVLCYDKATHKLILAETLPEGATDAKVMDIVRGAGG